MGDILTFDRNDAQQAAPGPARPTMSNARIDFLNRIHDGTVQSMFNIDRMAEMMLRNIPAAPDIEFVMTNDTVKRIAEGRTPSCDMFYEYEGGGDPRYFISFHFSGRDSEDGGGCTLFRRHSDGTVEIADPKSGRWTEDSRITPTFNMLRQEGAQADIIKALVKGSGVNPYLLNADALSGVLKRNSEIVAIYKEIREFTEIAAMAGDGNAPSKLMIIPRDRACAGAVYSIDKCAFCLAQYTGAASGDGTGRLRELETLDRPDAALAACRFLFDHRESDSPTYRLPLSASAYAETRPPYAWTNIITEGGSRSLTEAEEKVMEETTVHLPPEARGRTFF